MGSQGLAHLEGAPAMTRIETRTWNLQQIMGSAPAWILGAVLLWAALPKLLDPPAFAQALHGFDLLPEPTLSPLALVLPWLECGVGLGLIFGVARRSAALVALGLLLTFSGALAWNLAKGHAVDCGCFGASALKSTEERFLGMKQGLARNAVLALLALMVILPQRSHE